MNPVDEAVEAAKDGKLIVVPTDTVYGIATRADDADATARLFLAKERSRESELPVFAATLDEARSVGVVDDRAERLARAFWPGGLTMVLFRTGRSDPWELGGDGRTVGVRVPGHPLARTVAEGVGVLAITSANRAGQPVATTCDELVSVFGDAVEVYLCDDEPLPSVASTVVDLTTPELRIVRHGTISEESLARALA